MKMSSIVSASQMLRGDVSPPETHTDTVSKDPHNYLISTALGPNNNGNTPTRPCLLGWSWQMNGLLSGDDVLSGWSWKGDGLSSGWPWKRDGLTSGWPWKRDGLLLGWPWKGDGLLFRWPWKRDGLLLGWLWKGDGLLLFGWPWKGNGLIRVTLKKDGLSSVTLKEEWSLIRVTLKKGWSLIRVTLKEGWFLIRVASNQGDLESDMDSNQGNLLPASDRQACLSQWVPAYKHTTLYNTAGYPSATEMWMKPLPMLFSKTTMKCFGYAHFEMWVWTHSVLFTHSA